MDDQSAPRDPRPMHPPDDDERKPDMHALRTPLTVVMLRSQILRRHLRRGDAPQALEAELDQIDVTLVQLALAIDRFDRDGRHDRHG